VDCSTILLVGIDYLLVSGKTEVHSAAGEIWPNFLEPLLVGLVVIEVEHEQSKKGRNVSHKVQEEDYY